MPGDATQPGQHHPGPGNLTDVLAAIVHGEPDQEGLDALDAAERELWAINRADDIREGEE